MADQVENHIATDVPALAEADEIAKILDDFVPAETTDEVGLQEPADSESDAESALQLFESAALSVIQAPAILVPETPERPDTIPACNTDQSVVSEDQPGSPEISAEGSVHNLVTAERTAEAEAEPDIFDELDELVREEEDVLRRSSIILPTEEPQESPLSLSGKRKGDYDSLSEAGKRVRPLAQE